MIKVVNKNYFKGVGEYIGRPSILGNPFSHKNGTLAEFKCLDIDESINSFEDWIKEKIKGKDVLICTELNRLYKIAKNGDLNLICWCVSKHNTKCHGNVIKKILEEKLT